MTHTLALLLRRAGQALIVALALSAFAFFLMRSLPGDMAFCVAAGRYGPDMVTAAAAEAVRQELGLDRPMLQALGLWWGKLIELNLGVSFVNGNSVSAQLAHELGFTLKLSVVALLTAFALALPAGIIAGRNPCGPVDRWLLAMSLAMRGVPPFLMGLLLIIVLALQFPLLPVAGYETADSFVLPSLTLGLGLAGSLSRVVREAIVTVRAQPYYMFARTKGLSSRWVLLRHGLRNAAVPVIAYAGVQLTMLIEGVVVVESLFSWPGIGHALVHAIFARDVPMIQGTMLLMSMGYIALNTVLDLITGAIDPRGGDAA